MDNLGPLSSSGLAQFPLLLSLWALPLLAVDGANLMAAYAPSLSVS
jgi:hypothetical protein